MSPCGALKVNPNGSFFSKPRAPTHARRILLTLSSSAATERRFHMKTYGVGVLGCGEVWLRHFHAFEKSTRLKCVSVFDPATGRAQEAVALSGAKAAGSALEVINDPQVDIVAVLTPVFTHAELVEAACAAGKHLMLEKPLARTLEEGERIVAAIDKAGVKCFHPTLRALSCDLFEQLRLWTAPDGVIGPIKAAFYQLVGVPFAPSGWLLDRDLCFPPAEYDPHVFDTFLTLTGDEPAAVTCVAGNYARPFKQDDVNSIHVHTKGGRHLQFDVHWVVDPSWKCGSRINFEIIGERGLIKHNWFSAQWYTSTEEGSYASQRVQSGGDRWDHYHELIAAIEQGKEIHPDHHDGLRYVRIQDAAIRSRDAGKTIYL